MKFVRFLLPTVPLAAFIAVIILVPPPKTLVQGTIIQYALFFLPLYFLFTTLFNLYYRFWLKSAVLSVGLTLLILLYGLEDLNIITGGSNYCRDHLDR
jgi:hypothetical protein